MEVKKNIDLFWVCSYAGFLVYILSKKSPRRGQSRQTGTPMEKAFIAHRSFLSPSYLTFAVLSVK
jgi:hypothetical protein